MYSVGCEPAVLPYKEFFSALAFKTGGQYVPLRNAQLLAKVIVGGAVEEISLERFVQDVEKEVEEKKKEGITDEKLLAGYIHTQLNSKGAVTNQIMLNNQNLEKASTSSIKFWKMSKLSDLKNEFILDESARGILSKSAGLFSMHRSLWFSAATKNSLKSDADVPSHFAASEETYSVSKGAINYAQSERLVQKAISRANKK